MSIINAEDLEASPLADLHALASTLAIDGFRRLRKPDLVEAILLRQGGSPSAGATRSEDGPSRSEDGPPRSEDAPSRGVRSRRRRGRTRDADPGGDAPAEGGGSAPAEVPDRTVDGVVELLANGSGFVRPDGATDSDSDVYVSAAQARRCELVAGDRVSGPVRPPRRSERHPSLIRIDSINGVAADEAVHGTRIDEIEVDWPAQRLALTGADALLELIDRVAPLGAGSRVVVAGPARSGKTLVLGKLAATLAPLDGFDVELIAVGVRPEELSEYRALDYVTGPGQAFSASRDSQDATVEQAIERGRRVAVRGGNAIVLIDTLDGLSDAAARRALAAARNLRSAGTLTVIATATEPLGGETTVIALTPAGALDEERSGTLRSELLAAAKPKQARAKRPATTRARPSRAKPKSTDVEKNEVDPAA
jgi:transcription termination factor Rho